MHTVRIFQHAGGQAITLPAEFCFDATEVYVWRDDTTGNVVVSAHPVSWAHFLAVREQALAKAASEIESFKPMRCEVSPSEGDPFAGWAE
ncbi:MAG TPA: AbrB/MazE/SpoVT family DNA-binding domain-containing protein [Candidatus Competibacteraceae bacterium]|nr:AbrB/MazE/SpoVT family DNA-binding domain-containing protein [Candidatus Competibacteraceae bacterium]HRC69811.1 AbrB/MazE/SpoVT family DNA-binding domain-containing protein [Candidatus Competibacter denitrificans]